MSCTRVCSCWLSFAAWLAALLGVRASASEGDPVEVECRTCVSHARVCMWSFASAYDGDFCMCVLRVCVCVSLSMTVLALLCCFSCVCDVAHRAAGLFSFVEAISMDVLGGSSAVPPADSEARCTGCVMSASYLCPVNDVCAFAGMCDCIRVGK